NGGAVPSRHSQNLHGPWVREDTARLNAVPAQADRCTGRRVVSTGSLPVTAPAPLVAVRSRSLDPPPLPDFLPRRESDLAVAANRFATGLLELGPMRNVDQARIDAFIELHTRFQAAYLLANS